MITVIAVVAVAVVSFLLGQWAGRNPDAALGVVSGISDRIKRLFQKGGGQ